MSSSPIPSPPPDASDTVRGLINTSQQSFAGLKILTDGLTIETKIVRAPQTQVITSNSNTITVTGARMYLSGASDFKLTSTPTIAAGSTVGQEVEIINTGTKLITLQGSDLASSTLKLRSGSITLATFCSITVTWDGTNWIENSRTTYGSEDRVNVRDFGAVGDGVTDDWPAFKAAHDSFTAGVGSGAAWRGGIIYIPRGKYRLAQTWEITKKCLIMGEGHGFQIGNATSLLFFDAGVTGVRVYSSETASPDGGSAAYSVIKDIQVLAAGMTTEAHGIFSSANIHIERCLVGDFADDGFRIQANNAAIPGTGNANSSSITDCISLSNGGDGFHLQGSDVNSTRVIGCFSSHNEGWQFNNESYLGCYYINCNAESELGLGTFRSTGGGSTFTHCYFEYGSNYGHMIHPADSILFCNFDETHGAPLLEITGDGSGAQAQVVAVSAGEIALVLVTRRGTGYTTATCSVVRGGGQGGTSTGGATFTVNLSGGEVVSIVPLNGGTGFNGWIGTSSIMIDGSGSMRMSSFRMRQRTSGVTRAVDLWFGGYTTNGASLISGSVADVTYLGEPDRTDILAWNNSAKCFESQFNHGADTGGIRYIHPLSTTETGGRGSTLPSGSIEFPNGFWLGDGGAARFIGNGTAAPASGVHAQGDIVLNRAPTATSEIGYACITGGTPGTWRAWPSANGVNVRDFGAVGDGVTDDWQAFKDAHDSFPDAADWRGGLIRIPHGRYYLGQTWEITRQLTIQGDHDGSHSESSATLLQFPADTTGIRVYSGGVSSPNTYSGTTTRIKDLFMLCNSKVATGHGIFASATVFIENVTARNFAGDGFRIQATAGTDGSNANAWSIRDSHAITCGGNGLYVQGSDVNDGHALNFGAHECGGWGIYDNSQLGNTYIACSSESGYGNGGSFKNENSAGSSLFLNCYVEGAGAYASDLSSSTFVIGGVFSGEIPAPILTITDSGGGTGASVMMNATDGGGGIISVLVLEGGTGYTGATTIVADYNRGGGGSGATFTPVIVGGVITGVTITAPGTGHYGYVRPPMMAVAGAGGGFRTNRIIATQRKPGTTRAVDAIVAGNANCAFSAEAHSNVSVNGSTDILAWNESAMCFESQYSGSSALQGIRYVSELTTTETGGRGAVIGPGNVMFPRGCWIGGGANGRFLGNDTAAPASGEHAQGDWALNRAPTSGGTVAWLCTVGGTPGTFVALGALGSTGINTGDVTLSAFGSTPANEGAILTGQALALQPADATHPGLISATAQTIAGVKTLDDGCIIPNKIQSVAPLSSVQLRALGNALQISENGAAYRRALHPEINVLDFGADPTGVADSSQAFRDAISSFSSINSSLAGTVIVPSGIYRFASVVRLKKAVRIRGSQGNTPYTGTQIKPDAGVEAFVFDRYNTPIGTASAGASDGAALEGFTIQPAGKATDWAQGAVVTAGMVRRTGTGAGADWRRHYVCTTGGTTAGSGIGPRSVGRALGDDKLLDYDGQTVNFTVGEVVTDGTASGTILLDTDAGATGQLRLTSVFGTFTDNLVLTGSLGGAAVVNGDSTSAVDFELDGTARWQYIGSGAAVVFFANGCTMRDIFVQGMSGNGVHIESPSIEANGMFTNANGWHLSNVSIWGCDGHGLYVNGGDTNGSSWVHGTAYGNGSSTTDEAFSGIGYNIYESSFLGNQYWSIQMGSAGLGSVYSDAVSGGNVFVGCYQEGTGGGENYFNPNTLILGGSLASAQSLTSNGTIVGTNLNSRLGFATPGYTGMPWRVSAPMIVGVWRTNGGNIYVCTAVVGDRLTASSGGPTGTGTGIVDNNVTWDFVHVITQGGSMDLGCTDPAVPTFASIKPPDTMDSADYTYLRYGTFTGDVRKALGFSYSIASIGGQAGSGMMLALPRTTINEWPFKVPTGRAIFERLWLGGCGISFGTTTPTAGTFNPGDRHFFKGAACVAGGAEGLVCITEGTAGTYTGGRTATIASFGDGLIAISGAAMSPYRDQQDFQVGDIITVNGVTTRVQTVSDDGLTLGTVDFINTGSGFAITFSNPTWQEFGHVSSAITGATKTKITYDARGNVTAGVDATTADIADSLNKRYVTDAGLVVLGNTSGTNTGDVTLAAFGSTPDAKGATISGQAVALQPADATHPGLISIDAQTFAGAKRGAVSVLTSTGGSIAVDLALNNNYSHTLTENTTLAAPSNAVAGQSGVITFTQHASSPKTLAYDSFWKFAGGTPPSLTATNNAVDVFTYYVCGSFAVCELINDVS